MQLTRPKPGEIEKKMHFSLAILPFPRYIICAK